MKSSFCYSKHPMSQMSFQQWVESATVWPWLKARSAQQVHDGVSRSWSDVFDVQWILAKRQREKCKSRYVEHKYCYNFSIREVTLQMRDMNLLSGWHIFASTDFRTKWDACGSVCDKNFKISVYIYECNRCSESLSDLLLF